MRSSLPSLSLSNGAWTQTAPLYQSAALVEKTAWERPLTNVGTAGSGAGAGAGEVTPAAWPLKLSGSADAGLAATAARAVAVTAAARSRVLKSAPPLERSCRQIEPANPAFPRQKSQIPGRCAGRVRPTCPARASRPRGRPSQRRLTE